MLSAFAPFGSFGETDFACGDSLRPGAPKAPWTKLAEGERSLAGC
jgi:hypothetical protein